MSKRRRFKVESLNGAEAGSFLLLPDEEYRHVRVLRLEPGTEVELFDGAGRCWLGTLEGAQVQFTKALVKASGPSGRLILAVPWPKGKRAGVLVEKCSELGVSEIIPLRCARSVVHKDGESEGVTRLRRIAAEAAKQSGRSDTPEIRDEINLESVLRQFGQETLKVILDPKAVQSLVSLLTESKTPVQTVLMLIGPEGGFSPDESKQLEAAGCVPARLGSHILRMETAALAAVAVWSATEL